MDFEKAIAQIGEKYAREGYEIVVNPRPDKLPTFAKDFKVELVGKRAEEGVLVAVKKNRDAFANDPEMNRYAELTSAQSGWRFDFVLVEPEDPMAKEVRGAKEPSDEQIAETLETAQRLAHEGLLQPAFIAAWSGFEGPCEKYCEHMERPPAGEPRPARC